jgi:hypothetical protein
MAEQKLNPLERWDNDAALFVQHSEDLAPRLRELSMLPRGGTPQERLIAFVVHDYRDGIF